MNSQQPTWVRPARTAGHPPAGTVFVKSAPGAAAARYNDSDKGIAGIEYNDSAAWEQTRQALTQIKKGVR